MTQEARQVEILRPACKNSSALSTKRIPDGAPRLRGGLRPPRPGGARRAGRCLPRRTQLRRRRDLGRPWHPAGQARRTRPDRTELDRAAALLAKAKRLGCWSAAASHQRRMTPARSRGSQKILVAHTMSGKGAIACTHPLSAGVFGRYSHRQRLRGGGRPAHRRRPQAGRSPPTFRLMPAGIPIVHIEIVPENRPHHACRCRPGLRRETRAGRPARRPACRPAPRWAPTSPPLSPAHGRLARRRRGPPQSTTPINVGRLINELNIAMADDDIPSPMAASPLGRPVVQYQARGLPLHRVAASPPSATAHRCDGRADGCRPEAPRRRPDRRWRFQHDHRRDRDRPPRRPIRCSRLQQWRPPCEGSARSTGNQSSNSPKPTTLPPPAPSVAGIRVGPASFAPPSAKASPIQPDHPRRSCHRDPARMLPGTDNHPARGEGRPPGLRCRLELN